MRLWIAIMCSLVCLSGCTHYTYLTADDFQRGTATRLQFSRDNYNCQIDAGVAQNMTGGGDLRGVFNDAYVACMKKRGYATTNIDMLGIAG